MGIGFVISDLRFPSCEEICDAVILELEYLGIELAKGKKKTNS